MTKVPPSQTTGFPFTEEYISPAQLFVNGGNITLTHGLARRPPFVVASVVCTAAEAGWAVGEELMLNPQIWWPNAYQGVSIAYENDTQLFVVFAGSGLNVPVKTTGNGTTLTPANWDLFIKAWA